MIKVFREDDCFEVWLDTEVSDKDGICLGCDKSRHEAIQQANHSLTEAIQSLLDFERDEVEDA